MALLHWTWDTWRFSKSKPLVVALLRALPNKQRSASAAFFGQRPWQLVEPSFFACAVRPTPPQKRRNTTPRFIASTPFKYCYASARDLPLMAWQHSRMFLKEMRRSEPRALADFSESSGSLAYFTICIRRAHTSRRRQSSRSSMSICRTRA